MHLRSHLVSVLLVMMLCVLSPAYVGDAMAGPRERTRQFIDQWGRKLSMPTPVQLAAMRPLLSADFAHTIKRARDAHDAFVAAHPDWKPRFSEISFAGVEDNNFDGYTLGSVVAIDGKRHGVAVAFHETEASSTYVAWWRYVWVKEEQEWRLDDAIRLGDDSVGHGTSLKTLLRTDEADD